MLLHPKNTLFTPFIFYSIRLIIKRDVNDIEIYKKIITDNFSVHRKKILFFIKEKNKNYIKDSSRWL